jgi:hypothetical protein
MQYDFNLGPNTSTTIEVAGKFFKYKSGAGVIRVRTSKGGVVDLLPGQGVWNVDFTGLTIADRSGIQNVGVILAGDFDFHDDRITGSVEVIDGGRARAKNNTACMGYAGQPKAAGMYSQVQLFNPATSGNNLFVGQVSFYSNGIGGVLMARFDTPLESFVRNGGRKHLGYPNSSAELRTNTNAIQQIMTVPGPMAAIDAATKVMKFIEPILIEPGRGLILTANNVNEDIGGTFEFFEEPV